MNTGLGCTKAVSRFQDSSYISTGSLCMVSNVWNVRELIRANDCIMANTLGLYVPLQLYRTSRRVYDIRWQRC